MQCVMQKWCPSALPKKSDSSHSDRGTAWLKTCDARWFTVGFSVSVVLNARHLDTAHSLGRLGRFPFLFDGLLSFLGLHGHLDVRALDRGLTGIFSPPFFRCGGLLISRRPLDASGKLPGHDLTSHGEIMATAVNAANLERCHAFLRDLQTVAGRPNSTLRIESHTTREAFLGHETVDHMQDKNADAVFALQRGHSSRQHLSHLRGKANTAEVRKEVHPRMFAHDGAVGSQRTQILVRQWHATQRGAETKQQLACCPSQASLQFVTKKARMQVNQQSGVHVHETLCRGR
mmetsp:Transcript_44041/g.116482  ORF Transcript_44041/g.116482 Transcript_44041/m.116482 type:complete len:289 (+) Transcript_44041:103-969(+)|eukprot:CAMPEP_0194518218 /NCGR_PEP_ID=MMETSP0253-20130528/51580_1 /TAXON_ID=2966 /ORGANISM="Noctiluca scintillans" /LENGTH=288 /DNA_ID=CAMNT_0039362245 /DNA_START=26 /DNA_END=892 /DNA_ORIENTATION=-